MREIVIEKDDVRSFDVQSKENSRFPPLHSNIWNTSLRINI